MKPKPIATPNHINLTDVTMRHSRHTDLFFFSVSFIVLCGFGLLMYGSTGHDDPHITFTAAYQLATTGHILNINGQAIEQSSSLLHVLLLASLYKISGIALANLALGISVLASLGALIVLSALAKQANIQHRYLLLCCVMASVCFNYWMMGGLETSLAAFLVLCFMQALINFQGTITLKSTVLLFVSAALYILTRPEAFFVLVSACIALLAYQTRHASLISARASLIACVLFLATFALTVLLRLELYGQIFPEPVIAKSSDFKTSKLFFGLIYPLYSAQISLIIALFVLLFMGVRTLVTPQTNRTILIATALAAGFWCFILLSGGDWMGGGRFFTPVVAILFLIVFSLVEKSAHAKKWLCGLFLLLCSETAFFHQNISTGMPFYQAYANQQALGLNTDARRHEVNAYPFAETHNLIHLMDIRLLSELKPRLKHLANAGTTHNTALSIASVQMGMVPFYILLNFGTAFEVIDLRGLSTRHIQQCQWFDRAPRQWTGIFVTYPQLLKALAERPANECPTLKKPDIIYDFLNLKGLEEKTLTALKNAGYSIVYRQQGQFSGKQGRASLNANAFIAVKNELVPLLPKPLRYAEFTLLQP